MEFKETGLQGCFEILPSRFEDMRGSLTKVLHASSYAEKSLVYHFVEEYYSISRKNTLRGMHFQVPPHDHVKLVYCIQGEVMDVVVDLRLGSPTYKQCISMKLDDKKGSAIYIPKGCAHGFYVHSEMATMVYKTSSEYHPESDAGIHWSSIDVSWPDSSPILSERDEEFLKLDEFVSPFVLIA